MSVDKDPLAAYRRDSLSISGSDIVTVSVTLVYPSGVRFADLLAKANGLLSSLSPVGRSWIVLCDSFPSELAFSCVRTDRLNFHVLLAQMFESSPTNL